jgi:hypothetical protein
MLSLYSTLGRDRFGLGYDRSTPITDLKYNSCRCRDPGLLRQLVSTSIKRKLPCWELESSLNFMSFMVLKYVIHI